jgi:hypothetical protein
MSNTELGLRETARRHDISPGYLSQRVREGKAAKGQDLASYALLDDEGGIEGFAFPEGYDFPVNPEAESELRENPSSVAPNAPNTENEQSDASVLSKTGDGTTVPASDWRSEAACLASDLCEDDPTQAATALLEAAKIAGATGAGLAAGKYVYDRSHDTPEIPRETRDNPDREANDAVASKQDESVLPAVGVGLLAFLGADYGLRGDNSLTVRSAQWIADQLTGDSPARPAGSASEEALRASRQPAIGDGAPSQNAGASHSSDGAASQVPNLDWERLAEKARQ